MDPEENYDPDCDVSRFLTFPDPPLDELMLSPLQSPLPCPPLSQAMFGSVSSPLVGGDINTVQVPIMSVKPEPLNVEDVIISAMEAVRIEGSSSSTDKPVDEVLYEPIFKDHLPGHRDCTSCVILREVTHSSPNRNMIFTVHGGLGTFDHAVFDVEYFKGSGQLDKHELFYVDLRTRSHNWVKNFMVGCVTLLQSDTTGTTKDSLCSFYDTLCADMNTPVDEALGIDFGPTLSALRDSNDYFIQLPPNFEVGETSRTKNHMERDKDSKFDLPIDMKPTIVVPNPTALSPDSTRAPAATPTMVSTDFMQVSGSSTESLTTVEDAQPATKIESVYSFQRAPTRTALALQRQRTANMKLSELSDYLHLPIAEAARQLNVCSTALKHVCRRNGLARWPSRQIQAIDRNIAKLKLDLVHGNKRGKLFAIMDEIEDLQIKRALIYEKMLSEN